LTRFSICSIALRHRLYVSLTPILAPSL
jgi:hypothetical protein